MAFTSLRVQVLGLYGERGILPIREVLDQARAIPARKARLRRLPSVFWLGSSDEALVSACRAGQVLAVVLMLDLAPRYVAAALWALYLSFVAVGRDFLGFQWDALLLETGLHAILVAPPGVRSKLDRQGPPAESVLLMRWLAWRFYYEAGAAKLQSEDVTWRSRTACRYHWETQPLPTPLGWYVHHLSPRAQHVATTAALAGECVVPFLAFAPRRPRRLGFWLLSGLQSAIAATGNYGFFNPLAVTLALWLLDDEALGRRVRSLSDRGPEPRRGPAPGLRGRVRRWVHAGFAGALFAVSLTQHLLRYGKRAPPRALLRAAAFSEPLQSIHSYGLFANMTTTRPEIVIEGSDDGRRWEEYRFRYKPGDPKARPRWVAPHQPRLDWQMWFAALDPFPPAWFVSLLERLLEGSPDVLGLLERSPFHDRPPRYVRAVLYRYRMTDLETHRRTGAWWARERLGLYVPAVALQLAGAEGAQGTALANPRAPRGRTREEPIHVSHDLFRRFLRSRRDPARVHG